MMDWYHDSSKKIKSVSFIVLWSVFLIVISKSFRFLFLNIYLPFIYPLILIIFLSLEFNHPHVLYIFELRRKKPSIFFKQILTLTYQKIMYVILIMIGHIIMMVSYHLSFNLTFLMMLNASTLWIHGLFNPLTTSLFYKVFGFVVIYLSHHFLQDLSFYKEIYFLYLIPSNVKQILVILTTFIILQWIHLLSIEKKVF